MILIIINGGSILGQYITIAILRPEQDYQECQDYYGTVYGDNCYWVSNEQDLKAVGEETHINGAYPIFSATEIPTKQIAKQQDTYTGFDFDEVWEMPENSYPILKVPEELTEVPKITSIGWSATNWTNQAVTLTVNASGGKNQIASADGYSFDDGKTWQTSNTRTYENNTDDIRVRVKDTEGNIAIFGQILGVDYIEKNAPTIEITSNGTTAVPYTNIKISVTDTGGSGLNESNTYQYQLGENNMQAPSGEWQGYTNGQEFTIGTGLTGEYYVWVKPVSDVAGNQSVGNVLGYTVSEKFIFDNTKPTVTVTTDKEVYKAGETATITATFSENVQEGTPRISMNGAVTVASQAMTKSSDMVYTYSYLIPSSIPNASGTQTITISGAQDMVGNVMDHDSSKSFTMTEELQAHFTNYKISEKEGKKYLSTTKQNITPTLKHLSEMLQTNGTVKVYKGTTEITDENSKLATGMQLKIMLNNALLEYTILVKGDTNGDGTIDIKDILAMNKHRLNKSTLEEAFQLAGDVNEDAKIDIKDVLQINKFRLGKTDTLS